MKKDSFRLFFVSRISQKCRSTNQSFCVTYLCCAEGMMKSILRQPATLITCIIPLGDVPNHIAPKGAQSGAMYWSGWVIIMIFGCWFCYRQNVYLLDLTCPWLFSLSPPTMSNIECFRVTLIRTFVRRWNWTRLACFFASLLSRSIGFLGLKFPRRRSKTRLIFLVKNVRAMRFGPVTVRPSKSRFSVPGPLYARHHDDSHLIS